MHINATTDRLNAALFGMKRKPHVLGLFTVWGGGGRVLRYFISNCFLPAHLSAVTNQRPAASPAEFLPQ